MGDDALMQGRAGLFSQTRKLIAIAHNAGVFLSTQAHEGFHYLEANTLSSKEKQLLVQAFRKGTSLHKRLLNAARLHDQTFKTGITDIITGEDNPNRAYETRAYAFQFWKMGELGLDDRTIVEQVFDKLLDVANQIRAYFSAQPQYNTVRDLFAAIDRGEYADSMVRMRQAAEAVPMSDRASVAGWGAGCCAG